VFQSKRSSYYVVIAKLCVNCRFKRRSTQRSHREPHLHLALTGEISQNVCNFARAEQVRVLQALPYKLYVKVRFEQRQETCQRKGTTNDATVVGQRHFMHVSEAISCRQSNKRECVGHAESEKPERDSIVDYERLEVAVPVLQRPVNELKQVKEGTLFSWATLEGAAFSARLITVFIFVFAFLGGPIAYQTFDPADQLPQFVLAGSLGALLVTTVVTLRIYLGWAYVGERLLSATIEYEVRHPLRTQCFLASKINNTDIS
jgi:hypothetical protein